jgi:hypothetical protein
LIARRHDTISEELVLSWARLLADSGSVNPRAQKNAAGGILSFALEHRGRPVSQLIVVAFPIVYAELSIGNEPPLLFSFFFEDWDRCKTARRDIVQAFLQSNWPPLDLIRAVEPTGDLDLVLTYLLADRSGSPFFTRLRHDVSNLPRRERAQIETAINKAIEKSGDE